MIGVVDRQAVMSDEHVDQLEREIGLCGEALGPIGSERVVPDNSAIADALVRDRRQEHDLGCVVVEDTVEVMRIPRFDPVERECAGGGCGHRRCPLSLRCPAGLPGRLDFDVMI